jgi:hypothetical protein
VTKLALLRVGGFSKPENLDLTRMGFSEYNWRRHLLKFRLVVFGLLPAFWTTAFSDYARFLRGQISEREKALRINEEGFEDNFTSLE